jgi:hypothetical protein
LIQINHLPLLPPRKNYENSKNQPISFGYVLLDEEDETTYREYCGTDAPGILFDYLKTDIKKELTYAVKYKV